jgi:hypothetical protein
VGPGVSWRTGVTVTGPDGRPWVVRRRWVPRLGNDTPWQRFHRRFRSTMERGRKLSDAGDVASDFGCGIDLLEGLVVAVLLLLLLVFLLMVALRKPEIAKDLRRRAPPGATAGGDPSRCG